MHLDQRDFWQHSESRVAISEQTSDRADSRGAGLMLIRLTNLSDSLDYQHTTSNTHFPKVCGSVYPAMDYLHIANQVSGEWSEVTLRRTSFWYHAWESINFGRMPFFCSLTWANLPLERRTGRCSQQWHRYHQLNLSDPCCPCSLPDGLRPIWSDVMTTACYKWNIRPFRGTKKGCL